MILSIVLAASATSPAPPADPFHETPEEKAACTQDAVRLCAGAYPNERLLLTCMKANRASLGPACLSAFDAGTRRRGL